MKNQKAYFVVSDSEQLYELSASKKKQLEKKHPNWNRYTGDRNYEELQEVFTFFKKNGKLVGHVQYNNVFVGLLD